MICIIKEVLIRIMVETEAGKMYPEKMLGHIRHMSAQRTPLWNHWKFQSPAYGSRFIQCPPDCSNEGPAGFRALVLGTQSI